MQCMSDNILELIKTKTTAKSIIDTLKGIYSKKGISIQVQLQRKLRSLRFIEGTSLNIFLREFQQTICELKGAGGRIEESEIISQLLSAICELKGAGGRIEESEIISQLLSAMPESYQAVTTALDVMFCQDETKVTLEFVKSKLLMEESRRNKTPETETRNEVAFQSPRQRNNITWKKKNLPASSSKQGSSQNEYFPFKCHGCGIVGHKKINCTKYKKKNVAKQANVSENTERNEEEISFLTYGENLVSKSPFIFDIKFIIDSGATNHLITEDLQQSIVNERKVSHRIKVAKQGESMEVISEGELLLQNKDGRNMQMKNVWVCKNLYHNLLSVRKLEEAGLEVVFKEKQVKVLNKNEIILTGKLVGNLYVAVMKLR
ncbi:hypothetical protein QE152_g14417 [Popillia japonica]|uniref:Retrovirus-related Pol polyprotein from transposon TNT 1-94-like beta-barrel domain-containing protein n=1 Tax=Popillia japonica TaxID=7064 RepID=A0AAW1L6P0_POPJA